MKTVFILWTVGGLGYDFHSPVNWWRPLLTFAEMKDCKRAAKIMEPAFDVVVCLPMNINDAYNAVPRENIP
jgi:hypothetical protein